MFATAGAKSVGRNELRSAESSPRSSPDPTFTELFRSRTHDQYDFTNVDVGMEDVQGDVVASEDEAELILFAAPANTQQSHKIRLSSPGAADEPGLVVKKPRTFYFAEEVTRDRNEELHAAAVTGADVLEMSKIPWPGCAVPWKVRTLTSAGMKKAVLVGHPPSLVTLEEVEHKRSRKGKKSRMALRKKVQAAKAKSEEKAKLAQEKEEAEREKRTRRNREKKVKKKAREKAKKAGNDTATVDEPTKSEEPEEPED